MLAGCSSRLLSAGHKLSQSGENNVLSHPHRPPPPTQQMSTHRLDLPCSISSSSCKEKKKLPPASRVASCPFIRPQNPVTHSFSSSSIVPQASTWRGGAIDVAEAGGVGRHWERRRSLKRSIELDTLDDSDRTKRTRTGELEDDSSTGEEDEKYPIEDSSPGSGSWCRDYSSSPEKRSEPNRYVAGAIGNSTEQQGFEVVSFLTSCAESIASANCLAINFFLARLGETAAPTGTSPLHRVAAYFTEALAIRAVKLFPRIFSIAPPRSLVHPSDDDDDVALRVLDCTTPIPKFLRFTVNEMLSKAFEGQDRVHIIDFDIKQGVQWPSLLQSLASRRHPPTHVRITGIGESRQELADTGLRLSRLAESLGLAFEFHAVVDRVEDVRLWMLHVKREECVAINCVLLLHRTLHDETGKAFSDLLELVRSTNPAIVVMAEQEAKHNEANWGRRMVRSLKYYAAIFDAMDHAMPKDSLARIKVEEMFAKEIRNIIACEGVERIERHENFEGWKRLMEDGGFRNLGFGQREMLQIYMILKMYSCSENYRLEKQGEGEALTLKWLDQALYTVSAWVPSKVAGSSSTSQSNLLASA